VVMDNNSQYFDYAIWDWGDGTVDTTYNNINYLNFTADTLVYHTYASPGLYNVTLITEACGDADTITTIANAQMTGVNDFEKPAFSLYPVPSDEHINLVLDKVYEQVSIQVMDLTGKLIFSASAGQTDYLLLDVSKLSNGLYIFEIQLDGEQKSGKFIVRH